MNHAAAAAGKLALICLVSALVLGVVHAWTAPVIAAGEDGALRRDIARMAGGGVVGRESAEGAAGAVRGFYVVKDKAGKTALYILRLAGSGYSGELPLLAAYKPDGEVRDAVLRDSGETPGLGKKAEDPAYMRRFVGGGAARPIPTRKSMLGREDADAVSGSTVTFIGVGRALEEGSLFVRRLGGGK